MRKEIPFFALVVLCGLVRVGKATSCTSATLTTCDDTLFATGKCSSEVCACVSDYTAGPFGCQKKQTASVTADYSFIVSGQTQSLTCSPTGLGTNTYEWSKGGTADSETTDTLSGAADGSYTCKSKISGILSDESAATVVGVDTAANKKPTVNGMPTAFIDGMKVMFSCDSPILIGSPTYTWTVDGSVEGAATFQTYTRTTTTADAGKTISCAISGVASDDQTFPSPISTDIAGVEIDGDSTLKFIKGQDMTLTCKLTGGFPDHVTSDTTVTYSWFKDGTTLNVATTGLTKNSLTTAEGGSYTCKGQVGVLGEKESATVTVTVTEDMEASSISSSSTSFFRGGHFSLTCKYRTADTLLPVTYAWKLDGNTLLGVEDSVLQFNDVADTSYDGDYTCSVTGDAGTVTNTAHTVTFDALTEIQSDTPSIRTTDSTGVGNKVTFTCTNTKYNSPGVSYVWKVGTDTQTETSNTFQYTLTSTTAVTLKCGYKFGSTLSLEDSITVTAEYILSVDIHVAGRSVTGLTLEPLVDTKMKMECYTSKSNDAGTVTYKWYEGSTEVSGETSKYYEKTAAAGDNVVIKCEATASGGKKESETVTFTQAGAIGAPTVEAPTAVLDSDVVLTCVSLSYVEESTFKWYKGSSLISGATSVTYTIDNYAATNDGDYKCEIVIGSTTSTLSAVKALTGQANGKTCTYADECSEANMDSTVCENQQCKCMSGYSFKNQQCSGANSLVGSLVMMICAILAYKLF